MLQESSDDNGTYMILFGKWNNNQILANCSLVRLQIPFQEAKAIVFNTLAGVKSLQQLPSLRGDKSDDIYEGNFSH